jgi:glutathione synthase/RimK-type ligase-like ATP-grasp enzyme
MRDKSISMTIERNLILVHTHGYQDAGDFQEIARNIQELAPDIEVFIASNDIPSSATRRRASTRPTLVFSPGNLLEFRPIRGKVYAGSAIPKLEQLARFKAAGLPVPEFVEITPDAALPAAVFGPVVVIKPGFSEASHGHHMTLMHREAVRFVARESYAQDHPGRYGPMFAQRFIDTGPFINHHRVLTLFGVPLLAFKTISQVARPSLDSPDDILGKVAIKARRRDGPVGREFTSDPDILDLGRRTYSALPEMALQGVDIIREEKSGKLYVLESNPGGNTWIFSKGEMTTRLKAALGVERLSDQFDAFKTAAKVLIERTREEAE